jgi:hypothetical protein
MLSHLPRLFLTRHGDTAWTDSCRHTGRTDLPLNERGEERARQIGERLQRFSLPPTTGRFFFCRPASVGVLGFEHKCLDEPIIGLWNHVRHARE